MDLDALRRRWERAVQERLAASPGHPWVIARAREVHLGRELEEADYREALHLRDRRGRWMDMGGPKVVPGKPRDFVADASSHRVLYSGSNDQGAGVSKTPMKDTYQAQRDLDAAHEKLSNAYDDADQARYADPDAKWSPASSLTELEKRYGDDPLVIEAKNEVARIAPIVAAIQEKAGGRVYRIPTENIPLLREKIDKLNKRAEKLNVKPVVMTPTGERDDVTAKKNGVEFVIPYEFVTVDGETPKLGGWKFVATIDHQAAQGGEDHLGSVIRRVPTSGREGENVEQIDLDKYRFAENRCEHCGYVRNRKTTYIVHSDEEGECQVGSGCIKDFLGGQDPQRLAKWSEFLIDLEAELSREPDDDGFSFGEGGGDKVYPLLTDFLAHAVTMAREHGYTPRWRNGMRTPTNTADDATTNMWNMARRVKSKRGDPLWIEPTEEDALKAQKALDWFREEIAPKADKSEFEHNMSVYAGSDYLGDKGEGFMAYLPVMHAKAVEQQIVKAQKERVAATSDWVGEIKDRREFTLTVTRVGSVDGHYGTTYPTNFLDDEGNQYLWWGSYELTQGDKVKGKFTIKAHDIDRYTQAKITVLTRPHGLETIKADGGDGLPTGPDGVYIQEIGLERDDDPQTQGRAGTWGLTQDGKKVAWLDPRGEHVEQDRAILERHGYTVRAGRLAHTH